MPQAGAIYRVLVASSGDCVEERELVSHVCEQWNAAHSLARGACVLPVRWELDAYPQLGDRPQALINKQLVASCDLLVGTFWTRLGTPTGTASSGTAEEIMEFRKAGKPVLLYFSSAPVSPERLDPEQYRALTEYRKELAQEGLFFTYTSTTMLRDLLTTHIARVLAELPASHADAAPDGDHALECAYDWYNEIGYRDTSELVPGTRVLYEEHALLPEMDEDYYAQYRRIRIPENPFATSPRGFVKVDAQSLEWHDPRKRDRRIYETTLRDPVQLPRSCVVDILPVELETGQD